MDPIRVIYHDEPPYGWWAESPDISGWSAAAASYDEVRTLAEEGVRFALERDDVFVEHLVPTSAA
jgi:predicted RNase H-like HicB family nuclease